MHLILINIEWEFDTRGSQECEENYESMLIYAFLCEHGS